MNSTAAIFNRLINDAGVVDWLDEWNGHPAIFNDRAPDDFVFTDTSCAIIIAAPAADDPAETFTEIGRAIRQDIRIYAKDNGSSADIDELARDVRDLFHNHAADLTVTGGSCTVATATGPVASPTTDPSLIGRRVSLRLQLERN